MAWIKTIDEQKATGLLDKIYQAAKSRAGKVYKILQIQSLRPATLQKMIDFYTVVMHRPAALTRAQREMIAVVVSVSNHCRY